MTIRRIQIDKVAVYVDGYGIQVEHDHSDEAIVLSPVEALGVAEGILLLLRLVGIDTVDS